MMEAVIVSSTRVKFNFSLKELADCYRKYRASNLKYAPEGPFICCWIAYMLVDKCIKDKLVNSWNKSIPVRWDMFDVDETSMEFMNQWISKVNPEGNHAVDSMFNEWNYDTEYCISVLGGSLSGSYRQAALDKAVQNNPDVEFVVNLCLDYTNEFIE